MGRHERTWWDDRLSRYRRRGLHALQVARGGLVTLLCRVEACRSFGCLSEALVGKARKSSATPGGRVAKSFGARGTRSRVSMQIQGQRISPPLVFDIVTTSAQTRAPLGKAYMWFYLFIIAIDRGSL